MKRILITNVTLAVLVAVLLGGGTSAWAHGGQFVKPGDAVPPGLREPSDPTPPPPPPPSGPPTTPSVPTSGPPTPLTKPTMPTATPPTVTPGLGGTKRGRRTSASYADWLYWYAYNCSDIENLKWSLYHPMSSENPLFRSGQSKGLGHRGGETRWTENRVRETVIPTLLWTMDPKNAGHQDTESAAYIALAKVTNDPAHIAILRQGLERSKGRGQIIFESAALSLGLLRRANVEEQFTPRELDAVRDRLFEVFEDDTQPARVRGFAALSVGLLGDQPTGSGAYTEDRAGAARVTTERLFSLLNATYAHEDLYVGLMLAIGMQAAGSLVPEQREILGTCALKGRLHGDSAGDMTRSYAALALGRIGSASDIRVLENVLATRRGAVVNVQRSAAIGLGLLGRLVSGEDRVQVAKVLLDSTRRTKDASTKNFSLISLAYLLIDDAKALSTAVIEETRADETLLGTARRGSYMTRGFGAIALGLVLRQLNDDVDLEPFQEFRQRAVETLREGLSGRRMDKKTHAAFCTALGIARDVRSREPIREILADRRGDKLLRGYAALSLGLIGETTSEVSRTIADALRERSSETLRRQAATALGMLGNPTIAGTGKDAVAILLDELKEARTQSHKGQVVLALARVGDHRAVNGLVEIVRSTSEQDLSRALACSGLGLIGDLEWIPSLSRGSKNINYRASTNLVNEFLSIL